MTTKQAMTDTRKRSATSPIDGNARVGHSRGRSFGGAEATCTTSFAVTPSIPHHMIPPTQTTTVDPLLVVLVLVSNPHDEPRLGHNEEIRVIREGLSSRHGARIDVRTELEMRPQDLQPTLNRTRPAVVHFSGHGEHTGSLLVMDVDSNARELPRESVSRLFATMADFIRLVVLNSCYSREQAKGITEHVDCAIGMSEAVTDTATIAFAKAFYNAIGNGHSIAAAFEQGKVEIGHDHLVESEVPELFVRPGVDADKVFLVPSSEWSPAAQAPARATPIPPAGGPPIVLFALLALTVLFAALVVWRHEWIESGSTLIAISAGDADLKSLVTNAQRSVSARLVSLDKPIVSHDGRWFSGIGGRQGLTLKGELEKAGSKFRLNLEATKVGSIRQEASLQFSPGLLDEHVASVGGPILKVLHVDPASGHPIAANSIDPGAGDGLLLVAAYEDAVAKAVSQEEVCALIKRAVEESPSTLERAREFSKEIGRECAAPTPRPNGAPPAAPPPNGPETPAVADPRPDLLVAQLLEALKPLQARPLGPSGHAWIEAAPSASDSIRVRAVFFDARRFTVRTLLGEERGSYVQEVKPPDGTVFIINGSEFRESPSGSPDPSLVSVGLIYSSGSLVSRVDARFSRPDRPLGGLGAVSVGRDGIVRLSLLPRLDSNGRVDRNALGTPRNLLQTKWAIIEPKGSLPCGSPPTVTSGGGIAGICADSQNKVYARSAICTRGTEFGLVTVTGRRGLSAYQFMNLLAPAKVDGGFACEVALNLDVADTIQFRHWELGRAEGSAPKHEHASSRRVANFLAITPR